jgi:hypothetical protein
VRAAWTRCGANDVVERGAYGVSMRDDANPSDAHRGDLTDARGSVDNLPSDADAVRPVTVGTVLWLIALVVLVLNRDALTENDAQWWIGAAAAGAALGVLGIVVTRSRARSRRG